ncbi:solute carrier family 23 protein [Roseomonas sp. F4]
MAPARLLRLLLATRRDRPITRPPQLEHGLSDRPAPGQLLVLAAQQVTIQSIYLILPGLVGMQFGLLALDLLNFLALSVAAIGVAGLIQALPRGPIGSGYPVASIPAPIFVAVYMASAPGANLAVVSAAAVVAGLAGVVLTAALPRMQKLVPTEVAGVVVCLIGVSLLPRAFAATTTPDGSMLYPIIAFGTLAAMMAMALKGRALGRYAVMIGAALGISAALALDVGLGDAALLGQARWLALPQPMLPAMAHIDLNMLPPFLVAMLAALASSTGDLVAIQRAADGSWLRPDAPPIRRGLMASSLCVALSGLVGAAPTGTSSACVGLTIATRVLARRVTICAAVALLLLACCPKLLALLLLVPEPVAAAMLLYVCCFMIASGCQLMGARMLDARRTFTVGLGIAIGLGTLLHAPIFEMLPPLLRSPVTAGALAAILLNLLTAPLVVQRASFVLTPGPGMNQELLDQVEALGGAWGAQRQTMTHVGHALLELAELLADRGVTTLTVQAHYATDHVLVTATWPGAPMPKPVARPDINDLEGPIAAQEAFALWLATRQAERVDQRAIPGGGELRLSFAD